MRNMLRHRARRPHLKGVGREELLDHRAMGEGRELFRTEVAQPLNTDGLHLGRPPKG